MFKTYLTFQSFNENLNSSILCTDNGRTEPRNRVPNAHISIHIACKQVHTDEVKNSIYFFYNYGAKSKQSVSNEQNESRKKEARQQISRILRYCNPYLI